MIVRPVPERLVPLLLLHENAHEQVCRRGGDMAASIQNQTFSRERLADWIAQANALYTLESSLTNWLDDPFTIEDA
jgi:hypothetical protein